VDVRVIAATDADLENQMAEESFRDTLFHRLAGYQIAIPPLRERRDDIGRLFFHFLRADLAATGDLARLQQQRQSKLWLPAAIVARFARFSWPGNVRQLRNAVRQLAISNRNAAQVTIDATLERLLGSSPAPRPTISNLAPPTPRPRRDPLAVTDEELLAALRRTGWSAVAAAGELGVSRSSLYNLIDRSKRIRKAKDIPEAELRRVFDSCSGELDAIAAELEVSRRALKLRIAELGWDD
jgi:two-component system nitrogen regulation response regulator GlnG